MSLNSDQIKLAIAGICAVALALGIGRFSYTPILPFMRESLDLSSSQAGIIGSWNYFGYLLGSFAILFPFFSYNLKSSFITACIISILSTALTATTDNFNFICLTRFVNGFAGALVLICGTSLVFSRLEKFRSPDLRLAHFSGFGLGMALSSIVVMACDHFHISWKGQWLFMALICLILFMPVIKLTPIQPEKTQKTLDWQPKKNGNFILLCVGYAFFGFGYIIYGTFISDFLRSSQDLNFLGNMAWLIAGIAAIPSAIFWQKIGNLTSIDTSLLLSSFVSALGALMLFFILSPPLIIISCIFFGFGIPGIVSLTLLEGRSRFKGNTTTSIAILTTFFSIGQILGPYISGSIIDYYNDYFLAILISAISLGLGGIFMLRTFRIFSYT